jgi:hypothetical protein
VTAPERPAPERPPLRLVRGDATPEEIAAIIAVLAAAAGGGDADDAAAGRRTSRWADPVARARPPVQHGPGAWRGSALPH